MTKFVIQQGIDVNTPSDRWSTPLHHAVYHRNTSVAKLLLDAGADPSAQAQGRNFTGMTPAELAKLEGDMDLYSLIEEARMRAHK